MFLELNQQETSTCCIPATQIHNMVSCGEAKGSTRNNNNKEMYPATFYHVCGSVTFRSVTSWLRKVLHSCHVDETSTMNVLMQSEQDVLVMILQSACDIPPKGRTSFETARKISEIEKDLESTPFSSRYSPQVMSSQPSDLRAMCVFNF